MSFSFRLLPFALLFVFCFGCKSNPDLQGRGEGYLQGEWQQDSVPKQKQLLEYSLYHFTFSCDSFFVQIKSSSKVNNGADSCMNSGHWSEYIKGTYLQRRDTLNLKGNFCNADFSFKQEGGCFRSGVYKESFIVGKNTDSLLQLSSISSVIPINAHLIKRTTCNPKPL
ncbi:MAG: fumarate hydratase [Mucilaginibacter sp.]